MSISSVIMTNRRDALYRVSCWSISKSKIYQYIVHYMYVSCPHIVYSICASTLHTISYYMHTHIHVLYCMFYRSELKKSAGKSGSNSSTADKKSSSASSSTGDDDMKNIFDRLESSEKGGVIGSDGNKQNKVEGDSDSEVRIHYYDIHIYEFIMQTLHVF